MQSGSVPQARARLAAPTERRVANELLREAWGLDLQHHASRSGAELDLTVWPHEGRPQAAGGLIIYSDGTAFLHLPSGDRHTSSTDAIYERLRRRAAERELETVLCLLPPALEMLSEELLGQGFVWVSNVLTLECADDGPITELACSTRSPEVIAPGVEADRRLARVIDQTYEGSLSDPGLGAQHSATGFLQRLSLESARCFDRFVVRQDDTDAAVCLLSRGQSGRITVRYLGVAPRFRGRGLGSELLAASLAAVWTSAYSSVRVDVDEDNEYAVRTYQRLGFVPVAEASEFVLRVGSNDASGASGSLEP